MALANSMLTPVRRQGLVRISANCTCRIEINGRLLLGINRNRRKRGLLRLTPIGGALEYDRETERWLQANFSPHFESPPDLRLHVRQQDINGVSRWFRERRGREITPLRELYEELCKEYAVVPSEEWVAPDWIYLGLVEANTVTTRTGVTGMKTRRLSEVFEIRFSDPVERRLGESARADDSELCLVTPEEIRRGETDEGIELAENCLDLLTVLKE